MLAIFDVFGLSKIVTAKYTPSGLFITEVAFFLMDCEAMKRYYNRGITAVIYVAIVIRT